MPAAAAATLVIAATSICFGLVPLFGRVLLETGLSPEAVALYRFCLALPLALACLPRRREALAPALALAGAGLAGGIGWTAYLSAVEHVSVAGAGVVYMSYPLFVVLLARILIGHPVTVRAMLGALLVLGGALAVNGAGAVNVATIVSILPAPAGFALIVVLLASIGGRLSTMERWSAVCVGQVAGLLPAALITSGGAVLPPSADAWLWIAGLAVVTATLPQLLYTWAARRVSASRAATAGAAELPTMMAVGWIAFGESLAGIQCLGALMVVAAVLLTPPVTAGVRDRRPLGATAGG